MRGTSEILSSLPYQILLYCHAWYFGIFICFGDLLLLAYKKVNLPYPGGILTLEIFLILLLAGTEAIRNFLGQKGNLTERNRDILLSLLFTVPVLACSLYFLLWQTYVLRLEIILYSIHLIFLGLEVLLGLLCIITFSRLKN